KNKVKVHYYDSFCCSAEQCPYSCCQEWEITVDEQTRSKWQTLEGEQSALCDCLEKEGSSYHISLEEDKRCPFLNQKNLCQLVVTLGEDYLSDVCRRYPRHMNTYEDRVEYSLDFGCPVVIDLAHGHPEGIKFVTEGDAMAKPTLMEQVRQMMIEVMQITVYSLTERMMMICHNLLELQEEEELTEEVIGTYKSREYLDPLVEELRELEFDPSESFWERNELFQDMIQFYCKEEHYSEYVDEIAMWSRRLEEWYSDSELQEKNEVFEKLYGQYDKLFCNYLVVEIWASCLRADSTLEDMVMVFQWIVLEYSAMRQASFLKWLSEDMQEVSYNLVRDYMMIVSRMAGYDQSDIQNCLEQSFDRRILEWGYIACVVGNGKV
ncbi:MAG: flagellin lysine-N-methylase, partial [Cellulosilyticaceae bacterium]